MMLNCDSDYCCLVIKYIGLIKGKCDTNTKADLSGSSITWTVLRLGKITYLMVAFRSVCKV